MSDTMPANQIEAGECRLLYSLSADCWVGDILIG